MLKSDLSPLKQEVNKSLFTQFSESPLLHYKFTHEGPVRTYDLQNVDSGR